MQSNPYSHPQNLSSEPLMAADFAHAQARIAYQFEANRIDGAKPPRVSAQVKLPDLRRVEIVDAKKAPKPSLIKRIVGLVFGRR